MKTRECYERHQHCNGSECRFTWKREPAHDRRIRRGDDFAGDAWRNALTGELRYAAVGRRPN